MADPISTFLFSILVLITTITILKDILLVLMEGMSTYIAWSCYDIRCIVYPTKSSFKSSLTSIKNHGFEGAMCGRKELDQILRSSAGRSRNSIARFSHKGNICICFTEHVLERFVQMISSNDSIYYMFCFFVGTPKGLDFKSVMEDLQNIHEVKMVHNLHIWSLTMGKPALSVHLAVGKQTSLLDLCISIHSPLKSFSPFRIHCTTRNHKDCSCINNLWATMT